jgi:hypothetical protein
MKTKSNSGYLFIGMLGVTLFFSNAAFAAQQSKTVSTNRPAPGRVTGQVSGTFGQHVVYDLGEKVTLTPLSGGQPLKTETNIEGRYLFENVPPGLYEFRSRFEWTTSYVDCGTRMYVDHSQDLLGRIQVEANRPSRILDYTVGPPHNGFWAYGGIFERPHHPLVDE